MEFGHASGKMIELDPGAPFEERVLHGERPALVQCFSPYCGKCRELIPVLDGLSIEYKDHVDFVRVCTAGAEAFVNEYEVIGLPMLLFFRQGRVVDRLIGTIGEPEIRDALDAMLDR